MTLVNFVTVMSHNWLENILCSAEIKPDFKTQTHEISCVFELDTLVIVLTQKYYISSAISCGTCTVYIQISPLCIVLQCI